LFASQQPTGTVIPNINLSLNGGGDPNTVVSSIKIILLLTIIGIAPAILMTMTSFTRILIVFQFLRQALGTRETPSNQILIPLSLFMTFFLMSPVFNQVNENAIKPYMDNKINQTEFFEAASSPFKKFMLAHTRKTDLALFVKMSQNKKPKNASEISFFTVVHSFIISELKTAFQMGFLIYLPFFILDIVTAAILMALGMMMLPPVIISLPIKLVIFVLVDGWHLVVESMLKSF
jgi:flagellar biosynthetic protein FliP